MKCFLYDAALGLAGETAISCESMLISVSSLPVACDFLHKPDRAPFRWCCHTV